MTQETLRSHFPHTRNTVYLNHAAVSPMSRPVVAALEAYTAERHQTNIENYFSFEPVMEETLERLAKLMGTRADRVEFMPNTSYALNVLAGGFPWQRGDRIAVPACEFPANVYPFMHLERLGVEIDFIPHENGTFTLQDIERTLTPQTRLLTISWVQFLSGFRVDLAAIGRLCEDNNVYFCVDAIQGMGALQLDVETCGIDFLACGGHKWMMSTMGTGFLYVGEVLQELIVPTAGWLHGPVDWEHLDDYDLSFHPDARRYRLGTTNNMGVAALHAALGLHFEAGQGWCENEVLKRAAELASGLDRLGLRRYGTPDAAYASGIVTVQHPAVEDVFDYLTGKNIAVALRNRLLRFAPTYYNSPEEVEQVLDVLAAFGKEQIAV